MAIFLTEELSIAFSKTDGKTLAYFFCDSGFDKQKTATSIVRGLLFQLVRQHRQLLSHILPKYEERGTELFESFDALWTIFIAAAADQNIGQTYCIIDALDECDQKSQNILLHQLQETFQNAPLNIRILITSRPYPEIHECLKVFINKDLTSFLKIKEDINQYIKEKVAYLARKKDYTATVQQKISNILKDKAESTFLWIGLACEQLEKLYAKDAIQALQEMPKGLHSLYKKLLNTAQEGSEAGIIKRILGLVAVCVRPLCVLELSEACQLYENEDTETRAQFTRDQIASCRLMIIIQEERVLLLHQSVKDYLLGAGSDYFIDIFESHANIAYRCVNLLIEQFHGKQSHIHFWSYATIHWVNHARMAQSSFKVRDSEAEFFRVDSPSREQWLETLRSNQRFPSIPKQFSILHVAARWGIVALVDYIARPNYQQLGIETIPSLLDFNCIDSNSRTPMEEAVRSGHSSIVSKLLGLKVKISERVVEAAAGDWQNGKEIIALLLDHPGNEITITEEIVKAAARNLKVEVMALLLDRRGNEITITEEVVKAAAENSNEEVMTLLLDRRGNEFTITEEVVKAAVRSLNKEVIALLLNRRGNEFTITEEVLETTAKSSNEELMTLLLDRRGSEIIITEEVIKAAAGNIYSKEIMTLLLDRRGNEITVTEEVLKAVAKDSSEEVMALLLDRRGNEITITEEVLKAAAGNWRNGMEIMLLLLNQRGHQVTITEQVVKAAARNLQGEKIMTVLLILRGNEITITEEVLKAAAGNWIDGKEIITLLLHQRGHQVIITEEVVKAAAKNTNKEVITLLLDR
jgi:proteasome lid subunit RPN8/RPN11